MAFQRILALDVATRTGWAFRSDAVGLVSGVEDFSGGRFLTRFREWLRGEIARFDPDLIVHEAAFSRGTWAEVLVDARGVLRQVAEEHGIAIKDVQPQTLKKHATGHPRAEKKAMVAAAEAMGWRIRQHDEADALWVMHYAREKFCAAATPETAAAAAVRAPRRARSH